MASDQVVIALGILAVAGPIVTAGVGWWFQGEREKANHAAEVERDRVQQNHELRRDRQARFLESRLANYRERIKACETLLASVRQTSIVAELRQHASEEWNKPRSEESVAAYNAVAGAYSQSRELAERYATEALQLLGVDEDAAKIIEAYYALPLDAFLQAPFDKDVRPAWMGAVGTLRQAVYDYTRLLNVRVFGDDPTSPA